MIGVSLVIVSNPSINIPVLICFAFSNNDSLNSGCSFITLTEARPPATTGGGKEVDA